MTGMVRENKPAKRKRRGCLIACLVIVGFLIYTMWEIGAAGRRAGEVRDAIKPGMGLVQVEGSLKQSGRHLVWFQVARNGGWEMVSRDEFLSTFTARPNETPPHARLLLTFMGITPNHVSFSVEFDGTGRVVKTSSPRQWD